MFDDKYKQEMKNLQASESLISDTLKKMEEEQEKQQRGFNENVSFKAETFDKSIAANDMAPSAKNKKSLFIKIVVPAAAACTVIALVGVLLIPQITNQPGQDTQHLYEFQMVEANTSISGGLQFGSIGEQSTGFSEIKRAESSKEFLPEGILEAASVDFGGHAVYLGYDEQQKVYYAVYQEDKSSEAWTVLRSTDHEESEFIEALEEYFAQ